MRTLPAQVLIDTHGHVELLLAEDGGGAEWARAMVAEVTRRALREAPGLQVVGWFSEPFDLDGDASLLIAARARGEAELPRVAAGLPGPASRFAQLPIVQTAPDGLPAAGLQ